MAYSNFHYFTSCSSSLYTFYCKRLPHNHDCPSSLYFIDRKNHITADITENVWIILTFAIHSYTNKNVKLKRE